MGRMWGHCAPFKQPQPALRILFNSSFHISQGPGLRLHYQPTAPLSSSSRTFGKWNLTMSWIIVGLLPFLSGHFLDMHWHNAADWGGGKASTDWNLIPWIKIHFFLLNISCNSVIQQTDSLNVLLSVIWDKLLWSIQKFRVIWHIRC